MLLEWEAETIMKSGEWAVRKALDEDKDCTAEIERFGHETAQLSRHIMDHGPFQPAGRMMTPSAGTDLGTQTFVVQLAKDSSPYNIQ